MEDRFTATAPIAFETALTTRAAWKALGPDLLELTAGGETLRVRIEASGPVRLTADTVEVNCPPYARLGIALTDKADSGFIRLVMEE